MFGIGHGHTGSMHGSYVYDGQDPTTGMTGIATSDAWSMVPGTDCLNWWGILANLGNLGMTIEIGQKCKGPNKHNY